MDNNTYNSIINDNKIKNSYNSSNKVSRFFDYLISDNFLSGAFGISIKKNVLKIKTRKLNKNENMKKTLINKNDNKSEILKFTKKKD